MKEIINYINDNAIVASIITLIISTIIQIIFRYSDRRYNEKQENKRDRKEQFKNKAELYVIDEKVSKKNKPDISLFLTDFKATVNEDEDVLFYYRDEVLNKEKYKHMRFYLKNIGNADINQLDICVTS